MTQKRKWRGTTALLLCVAVLLLSTARPVRAYSSVGEEPQQVTDDAALQEAADTSSVDSVVENYQKQISDISAKLKELEKAKEEIEQGIKNAKTEKEKALAVKNSLDQQIFNLKEEIALLQERTALLEKQIEKKQAEIEKKQADIDEKYALFKKRLRAMDMNNDIGLVGLVVGAQSFVDLLTKTDTIVRVADHDRKLMETLTAERLALEQDKADLEEVKRQVEEDRKLTESKKQELGVQQQAASLRVQDMEQMEREFLADLEKNKAMQAAMQAEIKNLYQKIEWSTNPYVGGEMLWPVPGYYQISSNYGPRFGGSDFHTGMDIFGSGVYGKDIVAANDGTVKYVNWAYTQGVGYGIYLILDHGGKISTLYGHCSNIVVSVGQEVKRGQKIAEVGSTGWSTGPHLHFEVRVDGQHTNPLPYVQGSK